MKRVYYKAFRPQWQGLAVACLGLGSPGIKAGPHGWLGELGRTSQPVSLRSAPGGPEPSGWDHQLQIQLGPQALKPSRHSQRTVEPLSWKRTFRLLLVLDVPPPASSLTQPTQERQHLKAPWFHGVGCVLRVKGEGKGTTALQGFSGTSLSIWQARSRTP